MILLNRIVATIVLIIAIFIAYSVAVPLGVPDDIAAFIGFGIFIVTMFVLSRASSGPYVSKEDRRRTEEEFYKSRSVYKSEKLPSQSAKDQPLIGKTKECPFCAETIKAKAIVCRYCGRDLPKEEKVPLDPKIFDYFYAIQSILKAFIAEGEAAEAILDKIASERNPALGPNKKIIGERIITAKRWIVEVKELKPPDDVLSIHKTYVRAFDYVLTARLEEFQGNYTNASAAHKIASDALNQTVEMWKEMGVT